MGGIGGKRRRKRLRKEVVVDREKEASENSTSLSFPFLSIPLFSLVSRSYLGCRGDAEAVAAAVHVDERLESEKERQQEERESPRWVALFLLRQSIFFFNASFLPLKKKVSSLFGSLFSPFAVDPSSVGRRRSGGKERKKNGEERKAPQERRRRRERE